MITEGDYGPVVVLEGPQAGRTGYYDDDGDEGEAFVYLEEPFTGPVWCVPRSILVPTMEHRPLTVWAHANPELVETLGVVVFRKALHAK